MQKPFPSAIVHLSDYGVKVLKILEMFVSHVEHEIAPRVGAGRHHPVAVRGHNQVDAIANREGVEPLGLYHERFFSDERLKNGFMGSIAGEECLVGVQNRDVLHMGVEMPRQVLGMHDVPEVGPEQSSELLCRYALPGALLAAPDDSNLPRPAGLLHGVGHPIQHIFQVLRVAAADVVIEVIVVKVPFSFAGFASKSVPKIQFAVCGAETRRVDDAVKLPALLVIDPPSAEADFSFFAVFADYELFALGVKCAKIWNC